MALSMVVGNNLVLVLDEENMERIQQYDPFEFDIRKMALPGAPVSLPLPFTLVVCYARKSEWPLLQAMAEAHDMDGIQKFLYKGYKETGSDHERGQHCVPLSVATAGCTHEA